jgi:peptide deformylase
MTTDSKIQSKILPIVGYGSPILREVCLEVDKTIDEVKLLANDLIKTMTNIGTAVGLAAPQVNVNLRMFIMSPNRTPIVVINPTITKRRGTKKSGEGCLSIPGVYETVAERDDIIDVEYYDVDMNKQKIRLRGFDAVVFQHEFDHLNGILFTDRLTKEGEEAAKDKLSDIEKGIYKADYPMVFTHLLKDPT